MKNGNRFIKGILFKTVMFTKNCEQFRTEFLSWNVKNVENATDKTLSMNETEANLLRVLTVSGVFR